MTRLGTTGNLLVWICYAWLQPGCAKAQSTLARKAQSTLGLSEVLERARSAAPAVLQALAAQTAARESVSLAEAAYFPRVSVELSVGATYDNRPVLPGPPVVRFDASALSAAAALTLDQELFDPGRSSAVHAAEADRAAYVQATDEARLLAMERAGEAYFVALQAQGLLVEAQDAAARRAERHESVLALTKAGLRAEADAQRTRIEVIEARAMIRVRKADVDAATARLASALGLDPSQPLQALPLTALTFPELWSPVQASRLAMRSRPEVIQGHMDIRGRKASLQAALWPTVGLRGTAATSYLDMLHGVGVDGGSASGEAIVYLRWSGLQTDLHRHIDVAAAQVTVARRRIHSIGSAVRGRAVGAVHAARRAQALLEQAESLVQATAVSSDTQSERYESGVATLLELLDAEQLEQDARNRRLVARWAFAMARLRLVLACSAVDDVERYLGLNALR